MTFISKMYDFHIFIVVYELRDYKNIERKTNSQAPRSSSSSSSSSSSFVFQVIRYA